ncbi:MAG: hypothetical protein ThorAB25_12700 [Candidatus Thorarchaeota archaeon AB_25]|nr:MAG: hypothetical protein ThorAB25_12700 [Candidatus Thorarchaeota archaeon AB_25]
MITQVEVVITAEHDYVFAIYLRTGRRRTLQFPDFPVKILFNEFVVLDSHPANWVSHSLHRECKRYSVPQFGSYTGGAANFRLYMPFV